MESFSTSFRRARDQMPPEGARVKEDPLGYGELRPLAGDKAGGPAAPIKRRIRDFSTSRREFAEPDSQPVFALDRRPNDHPQSRVSN